MNGSVMNGSVMNVVCYERSLLWMGLLWTWSVLSGLLWMVCFERVCFERTPLFLGILSIQCKIRRDRPIDTQQSIGQFYRLKLHFLG